MPRPDSTIPELRDSQGQSLTPLGRLFVWAGGAVARRKVEGQLTEAGHQFVITEGDCLLSDLDFTDMRALAVPIRRVLTHRESQDVRVLFKSDGGELTPADFPKVQSFTQFSLVSQSSWLQEMLDEGRVTSVLQPIVFAREPERVFARESLLRGVGRDKALVSPSTLLELARECGLLEVLDLSARRSAVERMVLEGGEEECLFINLMPSTMDEPLSGLHQTAAIIDRAGISRERIIFEITEGDHAPDVGELRRVIDDYRAAGFRVALDDVGAGYSSLNRLHQLRPDFVKLDMALIRGVDKDPYQALVAEKIIEIALRLGIQTIAEGIETAGELAWVQQAGSHYAQGYVVGRPSAASFRVRTPEGIETLVVS